MRNRRRFARQFLASQRQAAYENYWKLKQHLVDVLLDQDFDSEAEVIQEADDQSVVVVDDLTDSELLWAFDEADVSIDELSSSIEDVAGPGFGIREALKQALTNRLAAEVTSEVVKAINEEEEYAIHLDEQIGRGH